MIDQSTDSAGTLRRIQATISARGTALAVALSVSALVLVPAVALGVPGDFTQPASSPETVGDNPLSIAAANFNGDANTDLAVPNVGADNVTILLGDGAGNFTPAATSPDVGDMPLGVAAANFGGNASIDLAVANLVPGNVTILLNDGAGNFSAAGTSPEGVGANPASVAAANLGGDASTDLAVANNGDDNVTILLNDGTGSGNFTAAGTEGAGDQPFSVAAANLGGDASTDFAVANNADDNVTIRINDGTGTGNFNAAGTSPEGAGDQPFSVAAANLGGDANTDLAVANDSNNVTILLGNGSGDFDAPVTSPEAAGEGPRAVAAANLGGDANIDLAVVNGNDDNVSILLGDGSGNFTAAGSSPEAAGDFPASVAAASLNGDANTDLAVTNGDSDNVTILLNELVPPVIPPVVTPPAATPPPTKKKCKKGRKLKKGKCVKKRRRGRSEGRDVGVVGFGRSVSSTKVGTMTSRVEGRGGWRQRLAATALGAAGLLLLTAPGAGAVTASYSFDTGDQGWRVSQTNSGPFNVPTFNPAGFISAADTGTETGCPGAPCDLLFFASPPLPVPLAANYGGTLSFDLASSTTPGFLGTAYIDSANDAAPELRRDFTPPLSGFGKVTLPITEAGWLYCTGAAPCTPATQQQFRSVLATGIFTDVLADVVDGTGETYSLDNVAVSEAPKAKKKCKKKRKKGKSAGAAKKKKCKKKKKGKSRNARELQR